MDRLAGKVALVTGAASAPGIGFATARALFREGARVVVTDVDASGVRRRVAELGDEGQACAMRHDVTSEQSWSEVIADTLARYDRIDVLVNNAGIAILKPLESLAVAEFDRTISVNLRGVFLGCRAVVQAMRRLKKGGSIVNVASLSGIIGTPNGIAYTASKGGVRSMTKSIALECARDGIRCNSVHPGLILTDILKDVIRDAPAQYEAVRATIPLGEPGTPEDVANCILFLASDEARYVTGAELVVDGGYGAQ